MGLCLRKICSGGQSGADRAGLIVSKEFGLETGGWMPKDWISDDGRHPSFADTYGMSEHSESGYKPRTWANVRDSDGTIILARRLGSSGSVCTRKAIVRYNRPYLEVEFSRDLITVTEPQEAADWLKVYNIGTLNVAGNSERTCPGITAPVAGFLRLVLEALDFRRKRKPAPPVP